MITLPHTLDQSFAYALGRIGVLENQLLKSTDIDRLLGAHPGEEAVKMLRDVEFVSIPEEGNREQGLGIREFQETLDASVMLIKENIEKMAPEEKHFIFNILWLDGDRARISFDLKSKHNFTSDIAVEPHPPVTAGIDVELDDTFSSPIEIDDAISKECEARALSLAEKSGSKAIINYVKLKNELEATRASLRKSDKPEMESIVFEKEVAAELGQHLEDMQKMFLGPEALFSYAARALNHIAILKVLLTGKVNNLPIQEIKSLLPPLL